MSPASPILNLSAHLRPSSPPQTPTNASKPSFFRNISPDVSPGSGVAPGEFTPPISSAPLPPHEELSPSSSDSPSVDLSEPKDDSDSDAEPDSPAPLSDHHADLDEPFVSTTRVIVKASFVIEELSDFDEDDMDGRDDILHPSAIEYADSERGARRLAPDDSHMIHDLQNLNFRSPGPDGEESSSDDSVLDDSHHLAILQRIRDEKRRKRMSVSSIGTKRTMSQRGSDSDRDHEDVRHYLAFEEAGSSARRMKRKVAGHRGSLIFHDPPHRIDEVVEPPEELEETEALAKELPFYEYTTMEVDSPRSSYG